MCYFIARNHKIFMIYSYMLQNSSSRCLHFFRQFFLGLKSGILSLFECMLVLTEFNFQTSFIRNHSVLGKQEIEVWMTKWPNLDEICHLSGWPSGSLTHKVGDNEESSPSKYSKVVCTKLNDNNMNNMNWGWSTNAFFQEKTRF